MRHLALFAATALAAGSPAIAGCGAPRSSMLSYASARSAHGARLYADGDVLAIVSEDPSGSTLVIYEPYVEGDRVVVTAGIASAGGGPHLSCFDASALGAGWVERLAWREPGGAQAPITDVERGPAAREVVERCDVH